MPRPRDTFWIEVGALVAALVGGAALRYWLSTVAPFDAGEIAILEGATDPERAMRVPFIMMNGVSLIALYVLVRRSAGVPAAFVVMLALQASVTFQYEALRVRLLAPALMLALLAAATLRFKWPPYRLPARLDQLLAALAVVLGAREVYLLVTLPARMQQVLAQSAADLAPLRASARACGGEAELSLESFQSCPLAWPTERSLAQQEALWEHQRRLGKDAWAVDSSASVPRTLDGPHVALLDARGAGFIVVPSGALAETARRVLAVDAALR